MRTIVFLVQKEFIQIFRDRFMLLLIFLMPVIQLVVLAHAITYEIHNLNVFLIDLDRSNTSSKLVNTLEGSNYFFIAGRSFQDDAGYAMIEKENADLILKIPNGFERDLARHGSSDVQVLINAINGTKAGLANAYLQNLIVRFNQSVREDWSASPYYKAMPGIEIDHRNWYNPTENYKIFMVPGLLVALVTLLAMFLSALNVVREKELGTIEQLNVTTISKIQFILGKMLPFGIMSMIVLAIGLVVAKVVFHVPMEGSLPLVFAYAILYILASMGIGIFISNISSSQQQSMFTSFFFIMIFILMSGLFTPIESMPAWAQFITRLNPMTYFIEFMRMVLLKGSGFNDVLHLFQAMGIYAFVTNTIAVITYRKTAR